MNTNSNLNIVKNSPFGKELTETQSKTLAAIIEVRNLNPGEVLISENRIDHSLYVLISGKLSVIKGAGSHQEEQLHVLTAGELTGTRGFIDGKNPSATLRALTNTQLFCIEQSKFEKLVSSEPDIVYQVMRAIVSDIHGIVQNMNNSHIELSNYINGQHGRY